MDTTSTAARWNRMSTKEQSALLGPDNYGMVGMSWFNLTSTSQSIISRKLMTDDGYNYLRSQIGHV